MKPLTLLMLLFAGTGLLLVGISIPLIQRRIKPNPWYGIRTRRTLNDPDLWYEMNVYGGKRLLISGLITTSAAIVLYFIPGLTVDGYTLGMTVCALGPLMVGVAQSLRYLNRLTRAINS
jgi:hypothetical protein